MRDLVLVALFAFSGAAYADVWKTVSEDGSKIECPDFVLIDGDRYEILNDCYGVDPKHPVVESGSIEQSEGLVSFLNRNVDERSFIGDDSNDVEFEIVDKGDDYMVLELDSKLYRFQILDWSE